MAREEEWPNVLILEDDFAFIDDLDLVEHSLQAFFKSPEAKTFDVVQLAHFIMACEDSSDLLWRVTYASNAAGYLVHSRAYERLHEILDRGAQVQAAGCTQRWQHQNDEAWWHLQQQGQFYAFKKRLGYQRAGFSDLDQGFRDRGY
jgi:hypothetical protein